jgi:hypothetical protein
MVSYAILKISRYGATDRLAMFIPWKSVGAIPTPVPNLAL